MHPIETTTAKTRNNRLIRFSSNSAHALCNPTELMAGAFRDDQQSTSFILDHDGGWVVGPKQQLLFWVPPASRARFYCPRTALVIPRGACPELDLSRMSHGRHWQKCRDL
ncbi:hypothetical protein DEU56DRAFT_895571 [Suillus clintonianus]|uniref:uncharacterized protein n=1 Tax=Suillus clintonianus TaxID=1904413 RepID=UPI001B86D817|nr:uncharacterized protein DEU56DRAFT_895571 [Suillus clintonianus]KAG2117744.1 hypothetical protein DEU56DRAFT_895571 [Suillus clintonianus]